MNPIFSIGTQFKHIGKISRICTVTDIYTTTNIAGEIVSIRYVATHEFAGQIVTERDIPAATIARGLVAQN